MSFLNVALLGGIAALAIPLIIHLLNRSRFRKLDWGAMHLLETVVASNSRRVRLEQLLLLLIRCLIPALLAFCLARPVLTQWQALAGDAPSSTLILLDNSYSMDAPGRSGTRLNEAIEDARKIVESLGNGSDVSVLSTGGAPVPVFDTPVFDPDAMVDALAYFEGGRGATPWHDCLELATTMIGEMANSRRNLVVISDFQQADVDAISTDQLTGIREQISRQAVPPHVTLVQRTGEPRGNVAIEDVEFSSAAVGIGQQIKIRVRLKNFGKLAVSEARVQMSVDEQLLDVSEIDVAPRATAQAFFTHKFERPGSHVLKFQVDAGDDLKTDDQFVSVVDVIDRVEVLLVDGVPSREPMKSETDFLSVALTPFSLGRMKLADLVETRIVKIGEVDDAALKWARVVVLANVSKMDDGQLDKVGDFVRQGGGLLIFMGNKINVDWYNRDFHERAGLLPSPIQGSGSSEPESPGARIVAQFFEHPALQIFNQGDAELADAEIEQWYVFGNQDTDGESSMSSDSVVLMRLDNGDPLIVEKQIGRGLVLSCATSADTDWTNLPLRPVFVPLVQQLVTNVATRGIPVSNLKAGETIVSYFPEQHAEETQVLSIPGNRQQNIRPVVENRRSVIRYGDTIQPGVYSLTRTDAQTRHFAVETDRRESDITTVDREQLQKVAEQLGGDLVADADEYLTIESRKRHGREVWRLALAALLGLMFVELFFQQRFSRVRT